MFFIIKFGLTWLNIRQYNNGQCAEDEVTSLSLTIEIISNLTLYNHDLEITIWKRNKAIGINSLVILFMN